MIELTVKLKAKNLDELLGLLKTSTDVVESSDWEKKFDQEVELVHSGGEASLFIVNNGDDYHGVKISCCG